MGTSIRNWVILGAALVALAACGGTDGGSSVQPAEGGILVNVTLTEFSVEMDRTDIPVGVPVTFAITNEGTIEHNIVLEPAGAVDEPLESDDRDPARADDLNSGETGSFTVTFEQSGDYQLGCHIPGHYEAGMVQAFTVGG